MAYNKPGTGIIAVNWAENEQLEIYDRVSRHTEIDRIVVGVDYEDLVLTIFKALNLF